MLLNVNTMGDGSARPVVSMMIAWNSLRRATSIPNVRTKSPRTEQHTHPLSMVMMSSFAARFSSTKSPSICTSPNSFSITQIFQSFCSFRM